MPAVSQPAGTKINANSLIECLKFHNLQALEPMETPWQNAVSFTTCRHYNQYLLTACLQFHTCRYYNQWKLLDWMPAVSQPAGPRINGNSLTDVWSFSLRQQNQRKPPNWMSEDSSLFSCTLRHGRSHYNVFTGNFQNMTTPAVFKVIILCNTNACHQSHQHLKTQRKVSETHYLYTILKAVGASNHSLHSVGL
jgi:hypothetical protein